MFPKPLDGGAGGVSPFGMDPFWLPGRDPGHSNPVLRDEGLFGESSVPPPPQVG